jgi:hypothetical protein
MRRSKTINGVTQGFLFTNKLPSPHLRPMTILSRLVLLIACKLQKISVGQGGFFEHLFLAPFLSLQQILRLSPAKCSGLYILE